MGIESAGKHHTDMGLDLVSKWKCVCVCVFVPWRVLDVVPNLRSRFAAIWLTFTVYIKENLTKL